MTDRRNSEIVPTSVSTGRSKKLNRNTGECNNQENNNIVLEVNAWDSTLLSTFVDLNF